MSTSSRKRDGENVRGSLATEKLDHIFNDFIDSMKPFVLKLAKKTGKLLILCSLDIHNFWHSENPPRREGEGQKVHFI